MNAGSGGHEPRRFRRTLLAGGAVAALVLIGCGSGARSNPTTVSVRKQPKAASIPLGELQRALDNLVAAQQAPGAVLGIRSRGGSPITIASGVEPGSNRPLTTTDEFRVASITKTFVGVAVLKLAQQGAVALDDSVAQYVPDWSRGDEITIRQLLNHTSGIPPFGGDRGQPDAYADTTSALIVADLHHHFTPAEIRAFVRDRPLLFKPGSATSYSNINTLLLGEIVAEVTGLSLGAALHRDLLDPLDLDATHYAAEEFAAPTAGLTPLGDTMLNTSTIDNTADITSQGAAGAMVMSVPDLLEWGDALLRGRKVVTGSLADTAFQIASGGTGLGVLGFTETNGFCVFGPKGCPHGVEFSGVGGSGSGGGTRTVLLHDAATDTVLALAVNRENTPGVEHFVVEVLQLARDAARK